MDIFNKDSVLKSVNSIGWEALRKQAEESLKAMEAAYEKEEEKKKKEKAEAAAKRQTAEADLLTAFNNYRKLFKTSIDEAMGEFIYLLDEAVAKNPKEWDEPQNLYSTSKSKSKNEKDKEKQRCGKLKKENENLILDTVNAAKNEHNNSNSKNTGGSGDVSFSNENLADIFDYFFRFI